MIGPDGGINGLILEAVSKPSMEIELFVGRQIASST
jgi:hypothetical protein